MKILLFGGNGQVGQEVRIRACDLHLDLLAPVASEVDIKDQQQVFNVVKKVNPDVILNLAAYTAVDRAESDQDDCYAVNTEGACNIAKAALQTQSRLIYISTDYVFAGDTGISFRETDPVNPLNIYGHSKLLGEQLLQKLMPDRSLIIRTSSVHGQFGTNIVNTIIKLLSEKEELAFVSDQVMSPTWAGWLAEVILDLVKLKTFGIVHASCNGAVSWYEFASFVLSVMKQYKPEWGNKTIKAIKAVDLQRPAKRPSYSVLNTDKLVGILGRSCLDWQAGVRLHLKDLGYGI